MMITAGEKGKHFSSPPHVALAAGHMSLATFQQTAETVKKERSEREFRFFREPF
jgi:hypothetical protein